MLSNYTSSMPINRIMEGIEKMLLTHGAKQIVRDYDNGLLVSISFVINTPKGMVGVRLPARIKNIEQLFKRNGVKYKPDQPYKTGWKNIHDWIKAQLALIDTEMVRMEEVFLPYVVDKNSNTFFEVIDKRGYYLE